MPHWKTHIEISKKLNEYLNYDKQSFELFVFGSILPDINNGFLVKDVSEIISHRITHFSETEVKSYIDFSSKYDIKKSNPLMFGYFTHLYADCYFNNNFYTNAKLKNIKLELCSEKFIKQHDFKKYNDKFINNTIEINCIDKMLEDSKQIKEISITKQDIIKVKEYLETEKPFNEEYKFYKEEELDKI